MGKFLPIMGILIIAGAFWYIASENTDLNATVNKGTTQAKKIVHEFGNSGEQITFFGEPQKPLTEFTYEEKPVQKEVYNYDTGEIETITTTELVKVETSTVSINSYDIQKADTKVCKRGNQCKITGEITLIDPTTNMKISPPYGFFLQVSCETSNDPVMNCNNFDTRVQNILTYADSSFEYVFTTDRNDPTGFYTVLVSVASKFTIYDPETDQDKKVTRSGTLRLEIIP